MKTKLHLLIFILASAGVLSCLISSCDDSKSYAELLQEETTSVNAFLANQRVINYVPEDSVFEVGPNAPYYKIEPEGNVYMQVLNIGTDERPKDDDMVYFRYLRYDLSNYAVKDSLGVGSGNANDMEYDPTWFRLNNFTLQASSQFGIGIQLPMTYFGYNAEVNLVIKSQYGFVSEQANVIPFLYNLRYYKPGV